MSGGHFDYYQYRIREIAESIQEELDRQGQAIPKDNLYYGDINQEQKFYDTYPPEIQEKFREAVRVLKTAYVYAQRIDWFLSGDDSEESFLKRLKEELNQLVCTAKEPG